MIPIQICRPVDRYLSLFTILHVKRSEVKNGVNSLNGNIDRSGGDHPDEKKELTAAGELFEAKCIILPDPLLRRIRLHQE